MNIVERVARAICTANLGAPDETLAKNDLLAGWELEVPSAIAAINAYEAHQWQPIETAPRDGTCVIVYSPPRGKKGEGGRRKWSDVRLARWTGCYWLFQIAGRTRGDDDVTHWIPLPATPKKKGEAS